MVQEDLDTELEGHRSSDLRWNSLRSTPNTTLDVAATVRSPPTKEDSIHSGLKMVSNPTATRG